jgi:hypothetical protein
VSALLAKQFDGLTKRNGAFGGNRDALLGLGQTRVVMRQRICRKRQRAVGANQQESQ